MTTPRYTDHTVTLRIFHEGKPPIILGTQALYDEAFNGTNPNHRFSSIYITHTLKHESFTVFIVKEDAIEDVTNAENFRWSEEKNLK